MTTVPPQPVVGAFECFSPGLQSAAQQVGITDDASLAQYAASDPTYSAYRYVGQSQGRPSRVYYYFEMTPTRCFRQFLNADGLVDGGNWTRQGESCPHPRP